jgi:hypothetical protein
VRAPGEKCTTPTFVPLSSASVDRSQTSPENRASSPRSYAPSVALETFTAGILPSGARGPALDRKHFSDE